MTAFTTWGFFSLVLRPLSAYSSIDILFYRVFSCAILMLLLVALFKRKTLIQNAGLFSALPAESKKSIILINLSGSIFLCINWFAFIYVMNHISVKATSLAYLVCPVLTALLAYFILKEKLSRLQWISLTLSISGCVLLSYENLTNMFFSMLVGLSYACYLVSQRRNAGFDKFIVLTLSSTSQNTMISLTGYKFSYIQMDRSLILKSIIRLAISLWEMRFIMVDWD